MGTADPNPLLSKTRPCWVSWSGWVGWSGVGVGWSGLCCGAKVGLSASTSGVLGGGSTVGRKSVCQAPEEARPRLTTLYTSRHQWTNVSLYRAACISLRCVHTPIFPRLLVHDATELLESNPHPLTHSPLPSFLLPHSSSSSSSSSSS